MSETRTVPPAKTTERPAVAVARAAASRDVVAGAEVLDVPGDEQQRVVDADAEPDHRGDRRGRGADVGDAGEQREPAGADARGRRRATPIGSPAATTEPNARTRMSEGRDDADQLAVARHRGGGALGHLAAELDLEAGVAGRRDGVLERGPGCP